MTNEKLKGFISYSHKDIKFKEKFDVYIKMLENRLKIIDFWYDGKIPVGENINDEVKEHLMMSDVIFLLLSPDYVVSYSCYEKELIYAIEKHNQGKVKVIPILLKEIPVIDDLPFSGLKTLPYDRRPISDFKSYDEGFANAFKTIVADLKEYYNIIKPVSHKAIDGSSHEQYKFQVLKNGQMSTIDIESDFLDYFQKDYVNLQFRLMLNLNIVLCSHIAEFGKQYNENNKHKGKLKKTDWWNTCLYKYLFELSGVLQQHMIGKDNTCVHFRYLKNNSYETFVAIGYDEPFIPKISIPSDNGTIYASILFDYPVIKSKNLKLHKITHPNERITRDYITFTFKNLIDKYSLYLSMCISIVGNKKAFQKYLLLTMSILRLDNIIGSYIDLYIDSCRKIDSRLDYGNIGG